MIGDFEYEILVHVMKLHGEAYSLPIAAGIESSRGKRVSIGPVHTTLSRMERKGLLKSKLGPSLKERGGRPRRYYELTNQGVQEKLTKEKDILRLSGLIEGAANV